MAVRERQLAPVYAQLRANTRIMVLQAHQMMMAKELARDPRIEPKEGDELRKPRRRNGRLLWRQVVERSRSQRRRGVVNFIETIDGMRHWKGCSLKDWRAWAKGAKVKPRFPGATF